jgi:hypothetical protein
MPDFKNSYIPKGEDQGLTKKQEQEIRELIAAALANWTGITRFRTIETTILTITDFTSSQHNHQNAAGGGQLTTAAISGQIAVAQGGSGSGSLTGILKGNGASAFTTITQLAGTKIYYVADSSGGAVTRKLTFIDGVLTAET